MVFVILALLLVTGCTQPKQVDPLVQKGRAIYQAKCIVCHNADPQRAGAVGPEVKGASLELLQLRIQKGMYPQSYTPKRKTTLMAPLPDVSEEDIKALYAYLNSP